MDQQTPIDELSSLADSRANIPDEIETVEEFLDAPRPEHTIASYAQSAAIDKFIDLAQVRVNPDAIPELPAEYVPFLKLIKYRGGYGETEAGERLTTPFEPAPHPDLAGCYDSHKVMALETPDYDGVSDDLDRPTTPNAVFTAETTNMLNQRVYIFSSATDPERLSESWERTTVVRHELVDPLLELLDVGPLRKNLHTCEFDDEGLLRISAPERSCIAVAAPIMWDDWDADEIDRIA